MNINCIIGRAVCVATLIVVAGNTGCDPIIARLLGINDQQCLEDLERRQQDLQFDKICRCALAAQDYAAKLACHDDRYRYTPDGGTPSPLPPLVDLGAPPQARPDMVTQAAPDMGPVRHDFTATDTYYWGAEVCGTKCVGQQSQTYDLACGQATYGAASEDFRMSSNPSDGCWVLYFDLLTCYQGLCGKAVVMPILDGKAMLSWCLLVENPCVAADMKDPKGFCHLQIDAVFGDK